MNVLQEHTGNRPKTVRRARNFNKPVFSIKDQNPRSIKTMPHTADVETIVRGESLKKLFENNLKAMGNILKEGCCDNICHFDCLMRINITAADPTNLLVDFLSDALTLTYIQKAIFCSAYFLELSDSKINAQIYGRWVDGFDEEIKGVTYHEAYVKRNEDGTWESHIIFDI